MLEMFHSYFKWGITVSLVRSYCHIFTLSFHCTRPNKIFGLKKIKKGEKEFQPFWPLTKQLIWLNLCMLKKKIKMSKQKNFLSVSRVSMGLHFPSSHSFTQCVYKNCCSSPSITAVLQLEAKRVLGTHLERISDHETKWNIHRSYQQADFLQVKIKRSSTRFVERVF